MYTVKNFRTGYILGSNPRAGNPAWYVSDHISGPWVHLTWDELRYRLSHIHRRKRSYIIGIDETDGKVVAIVPPIGGGQISWLR